MKKSFLFLASVFVFLSSISYAQNGHTPLKCVGDIPEDFLKLSYQKYEEDKTSISKEDSRTDKKDKKDFFLSSNYQLDKFLQSGNVLFGDELTKYVNKVAYNLLDKNDKAELKNELRFYVVKSSQINAFATQQGMIFVTVGLLSQIENEAQLAFVLAHEISHFEKKHNIKGYLETKKQVRAHESSREAFEGLVKSLSSFSKDQELEADRDGFAMFEKAGYDVEEASSMMLVLQYSHLPFDEVKFDKTFFNHDHYLIPESKFADTANIEIEDNSEEDDSKSSHPNIKTRLKEMNEMISDETTMTGGKKHILSESLFHTIQKTARLENLNLNLLSGEYIRVVYEGYLLKKRYPENKYIDRSIGKGLYALSKIKTYSNSYEKDDYEEIVEEYEGESKVLYSFLLSHMEPKEISILALKYLNKLEDKNLDKYKEDLVLDLVKKHDLSLSKFAKKYVKPTAEIKDTIDISKLSKIEKIKLKAKKASKGSLYYKYAFVEELKNKEFVKLFEDASEKEIKISEEEKMEEMTYSEKQKYIKEKNKKNKEPKNLGIDKIIIIDPTYTLRNSDNQKYLVKSEKKEISNNNILVNAADKVGLETELFCKESYVSSSTEKFNEEATIKEWVGEYSYFTTYHMLPLSSDRMNQISEKYGTDYILLSGIEALKYKKANAVWSVFYAIVVYPAAPYYLYQAFSYEHQNIYYNFLINTKNGEIVLTDLRETTQKEKELNSRSLIYDVMYQIKNEKNEK